MFILGALVTDIAIDPIMDLLCYANRDAERIACVSYPVVGPNEPVAIIPDNGIIIKEPASIALDTINQ